MRQNEQSVDGHVSILPVADRYIDFCITSFKRKVHIEERDFRFKFEL
jgi:hypothetical protein